MTAEEKANKYAEETILDLYSDSELMQDFVKKQKKYAKVDFIAGYNEAMRWRDPKEELPKCVTTGDWDGKQSEVILAETITGKKFLAQCYEGFMDGSPFFDWYQVDEVNGNDWFITETVSRWMTIPF